MADEPITTGASGRIGEREQRAANAYRAKYRDGPPWVELASSTQSLWMAHAARGIKCDSTGTEGAGPKGDEPGAAGTRPEIGDKGGDTK
jgi:hypothetical protein